MRKMTPWDRFLDLPNSHWMGRRTELLAFRYNRVQTAGEMAEWLKAAVC